MALLVMHECCQSIYTVSQKNIRNIFDCNLKKDY